MNFQNFLARSCTIYGGTKQAKYVSLKQLPLKVKVLSLKFVQIFYIVFSNLYKYSYSTKTIVWKQHLIWGRQPSRFWHKNHVL